MEGPLREEPLAIDFLYRIRKHTIVVVVLVAAFGNLFNKPPGRRMISFHDNHTGVHKLHKERLVVPQLGYKGRDFFNTVADIRERGSNCEDSIFFPTGRIFRFIVSAGCIGERSSKVADWTCPQF